MKNKFLFILAGVLIAALLTPTSAYAWGGVSGTVIDGSTSNPWTYGADIYVINNSNGNILASGALSGAGTFSIAFGSDGLGCSCINNVSSTGDSLSVWVLPNAGPGGQPGTIQHDFTQNPLPPPITYQTGYLLTDSGPTIIELADFSVTPQTNSNFWLPFVLLVGSTLLVSSAVVIIRKRRA